MNTNKIFLNFITFLALFSVMIFLVGLNETIRNDFLFDIGDTLINPGDTPTVILNDYYDFRNSYIFTNAPFITLLNFIGLVSIFYLFTSAWLTGRKAPPMQITEVVTSYTFLLILGTYLFLIVAQFLIDIFINQLVIILFQDIYNAIYIFRIFIDWFVFLILLAYVVQYISNYIKYFDLINN